QASKRELQESLEYQTATSEVLGVISRSKFDLQPVLDTIAKIASGLCAAEDVAILLRESGVLRVAAHGGIIMQKLNIEVPVERGWVAGRTVVDRQPIHVPDVTVAGDEFPRGGEIALRLGIRTSLGIPLLREDIAIGCLLLRRKVVRPFDEKQIALLQTFADQAVIAIENTRLFEEVQTRNSELRVALEQQSATSELLKVIGRSTFDLQPVFETLAENAVRLCSAERAFISRFDGEVLRVVASHNALPEHISFLERNPIAPGRQTSSGRAALERRTIHIHDVLADREYSYGARQVDPYRTVLAVPMLRANELFGVIVIYRHEVRPFTDSQIALMETFADQAVIAIENARLLEELHARNRDLTALGEVGRAVSSTLDLKVVLKTIVSRAVDLSSTDAGSIYYYREQVGRFELGETTGLNEEAVARFHKLDISTGQTGLGEAIAQRQPLQVPDILNRPSNPLRDAAIEAGLRAGLIVPLLGGEAPLGALVLQRRQPG